MKRIGLLTSGGDCQALNATMRGVVKGLSHNIDDLEVYGFMNGYKGLIYGDYRMLTAKDFSGILTRGGTILGTSRQPFKLMRTPDDNGLDKVEAMKQNYHKLNLDCLVILGGNGTQKTANLLREEGLNIIHLPKTIDNDIWGTDMTFGFYSAVNIATEAIDCIHTTASSHNRVFIVEVMGHKVGWLTLYAGIASGAEDAQLGKKELKKKMEEDRKLYPSVSYKVAKEIEDRTGMEIRVTVPGHTQRGGSPCPYDRVLSTRLGSAAAKLILNDEYGYMVGLINGKTKKVPLEECAGKLKVVTPDAQEIKDAKRIGISFGD